MNRALPWLMMSFLAVSGVASAEPPTLAPPPTRFLDLDGDGCLDQIRLPPGQSRMEVTWGKNGKVEQLDEATMFEDGQFVVTVRDFSWLAHWSVVTNAGGGYEIPVLFDTVHFDLPDARGDALYCSSTDVAVLLYLAADGWRMEHLGY